MRTNGTQKFTLYFDYFDGRTTSAPRLGTRSVVLSGATSYAAHDVAPASMFANVGCGAAVLVRVRTSPAAPGEPYSVILKQWGCG